MAKARWVVVVDDFNPKNAPGGGLLAVYGSNYFSYDEQSNKRGYCYKRDADALVEAIRSYGGKAHVERG